MCRCDEVVSLHSLSLLPNMSVCVWAAIGVCFFVIFRLQYVSSAKRFHLDFLVVKQNITFTTLFYLEQYV